MPSSLPPSIPDSQLGLSQSELHILRQHQQIALSSGSSSAAPHYAHSTTSSRGRGHARSSASTSRAASAASSGQGGGGRLLLDAGSLAVLGNHFERLMGAIQSRVNHVRFDRPVSERKAQPRPPWFSPMALCSSPRRVIPPRQLAHTSLAYGANSTLHHPPIISRSVLHCCRRRRNRPLSRHPAPDR